MKKTILALAIIMVFAASSFASASFMTAPGLGAGKYDLLGVFATNHMGAIANLGDSSPQDMDATGIGIKGGYGIIDGLDLVLGYSADTYANVRNFDCKQTSGNTMGIGVKYTIPKSVNTLPIDAAVLVGYEKSDLGLKSDLGPSTATSVASWAIGAIISKTIGICVPYGGIAVKSLSRDMGKTQGVTVDPVAGTGFAMNLGVYVAIADNQAVAVEYTTENDSWANITKRGHTYPPVALGGDKDGTAMSVSGLSLGYVYMF